MLKYNKSNGINKLALQWGQHFLFWTISFVLLLNVFAYRNFIEKIDWIYTFLFHISLVFVVYVNWVLLIPKILKTRGIVLYIIAGLVLAALGTLLNFASFEWIAGVLFPEYYLISSFPFLALFGIVTSYIIVSTLLYLSRSWAKLQRTETQLVRIQKEKKESELNALKNQINPHFMLNSLNTIYGMSLENHPNTPDTIIELSENMQYLLYETQAESVPLAKEIEFLEKYVHLQKVRTDHPERINFTINGTTDEKSVAPLIFLPLIENAFKYGMSTHADDFDIDIIITARGDNVELEVKNIKNARANSESQNGGFGLENLKKRLDLVYQDRYEFEFLDGEKNFNARLKLQLS